jgi:hypothetical protein
MDEGSGEEGESLDHGLVAFRPIGPKERGIPFVEPDRAKRVHGALRPEAKVSRIASKENIGILLVQKASNLIERPVQLCGPSDCRFPNLQVANVAQFLPVNPLQKEAIGGSRLLLNGPITESGIQLCSGKEILIDADLSEGMVEEERLDVPRFRNESRPAHVLVHQPKLPPIIQRDLPLLQGETGRIIGEAALKARKSKRPLKVDGERSFEPLCPSIFFRTRIGRRGGGGHEFVLIFYWGGK